MHGHVKHLFSQGLNQFKHLHNEHFWIKSVMGRNICCFVKTYHNMSRTKGCLLHMLTQSQLFLKHKNVHNLSPFLVTTFTSASWDDTVAKDLYFDTDIGGNEDLTEHDSEWMTEFEDFKKLLNCSEEKLQRIVMQNPDLKHLDTLKKVKLNLSVLINKGVKKGKIFALFRTATAIFLYTSPDELNTLFPGGDIEEGWYEILKLHLETSLKGGNDLDNVQFLAQLMDFEHEVLLKLIGKDFLKELNTKYSPVLLKVKLDFLLSKGISKHDIACNLEILRLPLIKLERKIDEMKDNVGDVSLKALLSRNKLNQRYKVSINRVYKLLDCSYMDFSELQNNFLNNLNQSTSVEVVKFLLAEGIDKQEIIKNPYILGQDLSKVRCRYEKYVHNVDFDTSDQRKLLNMIVYDLEYGDEDDTAV